MTTVPEEAVKAAMDEFNRTRRFMTSDKDRIYAAIAAALPHLPQGVGEREAVLNYKAKLRVAFRKALSDLPEIAPTEIASILSSVHMQDEFWKEGKRLQLEHGLDAVAPRVEQECGAGVWSFIRKGILSALEPSAARELALEEVKTSGATDVRGLIKTYANAAFDQQGKDIPKYIWHLHFEEFAAAIRVLSSQDHADAGKVEGDGFERSEFHRGYVLACANIVNLHGADVAVMEGFAQLGISKAELKALDLCEYDQRAIDALEEYFGADKLYRSSAPSQEVAGS